jgi:hypothetical protein
MTSVSENPPIFAHKRERGFFETDERKRERALPVRVSGNERKILAYFDT